MSEIANCDYAGGFCSRDTGRHDLYCCAPVVRFRLGAAGEMIYSLLDRRSRILTREDADFLASCSQFRTLSEHAARACRQRDGEGRHSYVTRLETFERDGLMVRYPGGLSALPDTGFDESGSRISWLAIPTKNRPDLLGRALSSYVGNAQKFGRSYAFLVVDDSPSLGEGEQTKAAARSASRSAGFDVFYAGPDDKRRFAESLAKDGDIPKDVVQFALFGFGPLAPTHGGNRNAVILQTLGSMVLSADDDTVCRVGSTRETDREGLAIGGEVDAEELWFFPDRQQAYRFVGLVEADFAGEHERLLGRSIHDAVRRQWPDRLVDLDQACVHLVAGLYSGAGRIRLTVNGAAGDSGVDVSSGLRLTSQSATRARLASDESNYELACRSREIVRQAQRQTIRHVGPFMATAFGLDNRQLMPPFLPVFRGEDGLFGSVLNLFNHCYSACIPLTVDHAPPLRPSYPPEGVRQIGISDVLLACIGMWARPSTSISDQELLQSLGRHLIDLGALPDGDFVEVLRLALLDAASATIGHIEGLLRRCGRKPAYWAADMDHLIQSVVLAVNRPDYPLAAELKARVRADEVPGASRSLVRQFGKLLSFWPFMVIKAGTLADSGNPLARRIS